MIALKNISKKYRDNAILKNITVSIPKGLVTGILGPNGAGKSTLLRIMAGFEFADTGAIYIDENKMQNFNQIKKYLSYMPENLLIYPDYSVEEFLDFYHSAMNYIDKELLSILSLKAVFNKRIKHLSKGWHQRLKLYTAMANKKSIIVLDEPFDGFDPLQLKDIIQMILAQNANGRTFILTIHQLADANKICNNYILLNNGAVIAAGNLNQLSKNFNTGTQSIEEIFLKALEK